MAEKKRNSSKIGYVCMALGVILIAAAVALVLYNRGEDAQAGSAAEDVMPALRSAVSGENSSEPEPEKDTETKTEADQNANTEAAQDSAGGAAGGVVIDGESYMGYLSIPVLKLELPVMSDWDYAKLKIAPCRYFGSAETDDLVICAHNFERHFGRLKNLRAGDLVTFTDADGVSFIYEVKAIETLQPTQISEMIQSEYDLSLYTCTYGGRTRVTVRCSRTTI